MCSKAGMSALYVLGTTVLLVYWPHPLPAADAHSVLPRLCLTARSSSTFPAENVAVARPADACILAGAAHLLLHSV
jgi:hypothetical protein